MSRQLPHNLELERKVLGVAAYSPDDFGELVDALEPDDFYLGAHKRLFEVMLAVSREHGQLDAVVLTSRLAKEQDDLVRAYEALPISGLASLDPMLVELKDLHQARRLAMAAFEVASSGMEADTAKSPATFLDGAQAKLTAALDGRAAKETARTPLELAELVIAEVMLPPDPNAPVALTTGLDTVDRALVGLEPGKLYVYAGRPGMGKSAAAMQALITNARSGRPGVIFSLEMPDRQLAKRAIAGLARVNSNHLKFGVIRPDEARRYGSAASEFVDLPIRIENAAGWTIADVARSMRSYKRKFGLQLAVVDYLQLVRASGRHGNREQEVSEVSRTLKQLAMQLEIPVIAVAQLSRACEARQDKRPIMSDLRESGAIEQDADGIIFFFREDYYLQGRRPDTNIAEWIIAKNRDGDTCFVRTHFAKEWTWFDDLVHQAEAAE